ncbi:MAG: hypothetical protein IKD62_02015, partial [Oscillospiraceae bacterium]|nr:hypothetical protein [Oscillospiraceae bacterium]
MIEAPEGGGIAGQAKIVFDIVYPDGTTGKIETESLPVHMGTFATFNKNFETYGFRLGERTNADTGEVEYTITMDLTIDDTLVVPDEVYAEEASDEYHYGNVLKNWDTSQNYYGAEIERATGADGKYHMYFTYVSDNPFADGEYWFEPLLYYYQDENNVWAPYDFYFRFIKQGSITLYEPVFTSLSQQTPDPSSGSSVFVYDFEIALNDADLSKPITAELWSYSPYSGMKPLSGYELTYSGSDETWKGQFVFDASELDPEEASGVLMEMYIFCDYTLSNGREGTADSRDIGKIYSYKGGFLSAESATLSGNKLTAVYRLDES